MDGDKDEFKYRVRLGKGKMDMDREKGGTIKGLDRKPEMVQETEHG